VILPNVFFVLAQLFDDVLGKMFFDFSMSWDRLPFARFMILIPIVPPAMADQQASYFFNLAD
jgi:hypothetical protein